MKVEERLQRAVASYLTVALPADAVWSAIGHGGGGKLRGAILNGMGVKAGVPDLFICWDARTLFVELKAPKGRVSPEQRAFHVALARAGIETAICRSLDDVITALERWGMRLRARIAA